MHLTRLFSAFVFGVALAAPAAAQQYPSRPVRIIVAFTPGTGIDILAREVGQQMAQRLNQPFVVENRAGASGNLGMSLLAKAGPDGFTVSVIVKKLRHNAP